MKGQPWVTRAYQREMAEAMVDPDLPVVVLQKSSRIGYTKLLVGVLAYWIANDPKRAMIVQPTQDDYEGFSKEDLQPGLEECDAIAHLIRPRTREGDNTTALKKGPGWWIRCGGAHTGRTFRRIEPDVAIGDEVDGWPPSAGADGDQIELMKRRLQSVPWPKMILGSSPLVKGASRIEVAFWESDQRHFFVPCPHCDHGQRLRFGGPDVDYGLKFSTESEEEARRTAHYLCEHCRKPIYHREHQADMVDHGLWIPGHRGADGEWEPGSDVVGRAGFHLWAAHSPDPAVSWGNIAAEFVQVRQDPLRLQVFINTVLGETWEHRGRSPNADALFRRRESYPAIEVKSDVPGAEPQRMLMVPRGGVVLTASTDVQIDRLEAGVEAWGAGQENWKLEYRVFYGDPTASPVWQALWEWLIAPRFLERGGVDFIRSTTIDTGYAAQAVSEFVRPRQIYRTRPDQKLAYLWATKGDDGAGPVWPQKPSPSKWKCPLYIVKVNTAKDAISQRGAEMLNRAREGETAGPSWIHWPKDPQFGDTYFKQYGAEHRLDDGGWEIKAGAKRNEAWDVAVGNYAALCALLMLPGFDLEVIAARVARASASHVAAPAAPVLEQIAQPSAPTSERRPAARRTTRSKYING